MAEKAVADVGLIGLAVMGENLALNISDHGYKVAVYNRTTDVMKKFIAREKPPGGLVIWVTLPAAVDADEVAAVAAERGVLVGRGDLFHVDGGTGRSNLRLTFAQAGPRDIHRGIRVLGDVMHRTLRAGRSAARASAAESLPLI